MNYQKKIEKKLEKIIEDDDWILPPLTKGTSDGLPGCYVVKAGDGGLWVPVYIYVEGRKT